MRGAQGQRRHLARVRRRTVAPALVPGPACTYTYPTLTLARRLGANQLCGLGDDEGGNYTTEGITELCKGLKGSVITSLAGCAAAP